MNTPVITYLQLICFNLLLNTSSFCQSASQQLEFDAADSLCEHTQFKESLKIINSLQTNLKGDIAFELELLRLEAKCYERDEQLEIATKILISLIDQAKENRIYSTLFLAELRLALVYEKIQSLDKCYTHLQLAKELNQDRSLDHLYANYCIRVSSYFRFTNELDSSTYYANQALEYATKHDDYTNITDAHLMLGFMTNRDSLFETSNVHLKLVAQRFLKRGEYFALHFMFLNISVNYLKINDYQNALLYSDSALYIGRTMDKPLNSSLFLRRFEIYEKFNNLDSALYYYKKYSDLRFEEFQAAEGLKILEITDQHEINQKEQIIKDQQLINDNQRFTQFILIILVFVLVSTMLLLNYSRKKIKTKNKLIKKQSTELRESLEQKEILMAELQHRVKNNLQMIIGLLALEKDSQSGKNTDTILQESQNRIQSMAILHENLYRVKDFSKIDAASYFEEISLLIKNSYQKSKQQIDVHVSNDKVVVNAKNAIPLGLIAIELLSNSFKHAFKDKRVGEIIINLIKSDDDKYKYLLIYQDNGEGDEIIAEIKKTKGLGMEIVHGLVEQIKGKMIIEQNNGLEIKIYF